MFLDTKLYDPSAGCINDSLWTVETGLGRDVTETSPYYALTPDKAGTYTLKTEVGYIANGTYNFYQNLETDVVVTQDASQSAGEITDMLKALPASWRDSLKINKATQCISRVQSTAVSNKEDVERNISDILGAIDALDSVSSVDTSNIRLLMDSLMRTWEGRWYYDNAF
jgi:hypothetical protein